MNAYKMAINNVAEYIVKQKRDGIGNLTAFAASEVLAIAFCKDKEEVIHDILHRDFRS